MKRFLKRDLQARGCNPLTPNRPAHSAGPTPLDDNIGPFWLKKKLATSSGGVPGPSLAPAENSKGVPGPSLAPNPHFFTSLGRLRERSRRKRESSKYTGFYSLFLQGSILWPLQGDPPGAKKKRDKGSWSPQGPTRRDDTPPREPPETLKARKPSFLILSPGALL